MKSAAGHWIALVALLTTLLSLPAHAEAAEHRASLPPFCSATAGPLLLKVTATRPSGISPLLVFFDATATVDDALKSSTTPFQDISYRWNFGDDNRSGKDTWRYGSNAGHNSKNSATGGVSAHLYLTNGTDQDHVITVTAYDGTNTAKCQLGVTALDPTGPNGFSGRKTACVASSGTPIPGADGCPAGSSVLGTLSFAKALNSLLGNGTRILFKCGDTFIGDNVAVGGDHWSIGAYGGCEGTQSNRPVFRDSGTDGELTVSNTSNDGRIADLDLEGAHSAWAVWDPLFSSIPAQITLYNLYSHGNVESFGYSQGAQWGLVDVVEADATNIGTFLNFNENNPPYRSNRVNNLDYMALMGSSITGVGCCGRAGGVEVVRVSACRMCVISNNSMQNANNIGAILKLHNGNTHDSAARWTGVYTEFVEISDNLFTGNSGAQLVEVAPQNGDDDERLRNIVLERNLFAASTTAEGGRQLMVSAVDTTVRDNVFYMAGTLSQYPKFGVQVARRGVEPPPANVEIFQNTCYAPVALDSQACIGLDGVNMAAPPTLTYVKNNLFVAPAGHEPVVNKGEGNVAEQNGEGGSSSARDPVFQNASGRFSVITDFKPLGSHPSVLAVPAWYDALGNPRSATTPDRGALNH